MSLAPNHVTGRKTQTVPTAPVWRTLSYTAPGNAPAFTLRAQPSQALTPSASCVASPLRPSGVFCFRAPLLLQDQTIGHLPCVAFLPLSGVMVPLATRQILSSDAAPGQSLGRPLTKMAHAGFQPQERSLAARLSAEQNFALRCGLISAIPLPT